MNVEITETGESTDRAAAVRDAGAKVSFRFFLFEPFLVYFVVRRCC